MESPTDCSGIAHFLKQHDPPSYLGLRALDGLKGASVQAHRSDICRFLTHRYGELPLRSYVRRVQALRALQARFEQRGQYDACGYAQVPSVDNDDYRIALLLSFVLTHHRFEILESLEAFLDATTGKEPPELLSVGFGTGYELKMAAAQLPGWVCTAYDSSPESAEYATDLLTFFESPLTGLRTEKFPLEISPLPPEHQRRYGKIVLCEILEHLEDPEAALTIAREAVHPEGMIFATMAVNIAQEDHIFRYPTWEDARAQVERAGLMVLREFVTPVTVVPFAEKDRQRIFSRGNYVCYLQRREASG